MKTKQLKMFHKIIILGLIVISCKGKTTEQKNRIVMKKTEKEWKQLLTAEEYQVLREKGTERAFTGKYWDHFEKGHYECAGCGHKLFESTTKYDSDCGWPSFDSAIEGAVIYEKDFSYGMSRIEVLCSNCGGHLGHVFNDGPKETTGKRYCTNSVSIKFILQE